MTVSLPKWKLSEPVNEVVYGTRGFDTFGETFLLLAAVVSVVLLTRHREQRAEHSGESDVGEAEQSSEPAQGEADRVEQAARAAERRELSGTDQKWPDEERVGTPVPETAEAMSVVARTAMRAAAPVLAVAGLYLCAWGYSPGGGFPAGAVLLGVVVLIYAAYGHRRVARVTRPELVELLELGGAVAIVLVGLLGLFLDGSFFANWLPLAPQQTIRSGGIVQLFSVSELVEVATGLVLAVFSLLVMRHDWARDEDADA
jgi:multicomponent Na+:H+ antiporter subunit B